MFGDPVRKQFEKALKNYDLSIPEERALADAIISLAYADVAPEIHDSIQVIIQRLDAYEALIIALAKDTDNGR